MVAAFNPLERQRRRRARVVVVVGDDVEGKKESSRRVVVVTLHTALALPRLGLSHGGNLPVLSSNVPVPLWPSPPRASR